MPKVLGNPRGMILEHAEKIICDEGYRNLSIRKVAKSCGLAIGTIYNYFPTKEELLARLMLDYWEEYLILANEIDRQEKDFYTKMKRLYYEFEKHVDYFRGYWIKTTSAEILQYSEEGLKREREFTERLINQIAAIIKQHYEKSSGGSGSRLEIHDMAKFIVQNFIMMAQMKQFDYISFEKIIGKIFS